MNHGGGTWRTGNGYDKVYDCRSSGVGVVESDMCRAGAAGCPINHSVHGMRTGKRASGNRQHELQRTALYPWFAANSSSTIITIVTGWVWCISAGWRPRH